LSSAMRILVVIGVRFQIDVIESYRLAMYQQRVVGGVSA
jgi:hypothetical protein